MNCLHFRFASLTELFQFICPQINDIQKQRLTTCKYESVLLQCSNQQILPHDYPEVKQSETVVEDDGNTFEIVVISDNFEEKSTALDNEFEEFELLEVDHLDIDSEEIKTDSTDLVNDDKDFPFASDVVQAIDVSDAENLDNEPKPTNRSNARRKQKPNIKVEIQSTRKSARQAAKLHKSIHFRNGSEKTKVKPKNMVTIKRESSPEIEDMQQDCDDVAEGESDNEFPARDSDNEDWPSQETLDEFPKRIMKNGLLLYKGKELMSLICK